VSISNITCGPGYAEPQHFLKNVLQINALKTIRQLFVNCSMASLSLMETGDKELQKPLGLYRNKEILKNLSELA
jgi:hypothetical protein